MVITYFFHWCSVYPYIITSMICIKFNIRINIISSKYDEFVLSYKFI